MLLPKLSELPTQQITVSRFVGCQHTDAPAEGAFYHTQNLSTARFPVLSPRKPRRQAARLQTPQGLCAKERLAWVDGGTLYYGGVPVPGAEGLSPGPKQLVGMGAWLIVWPDGLRYNTRTGAVDRLANEVRAQNVSVSLCMADGTPIGSCYTGPEAPDPAQYAYWLSTAETPHTLKTWDAAAGRWNTLPTAWLRLAAAGIGAGFAAGDTVTIAGAAGAAAQAVNGDHVLEAAAPDAVVIAGLAEQAGAEAALTLARKLPQMDFLTECGNRLWGCSSAANELYACKLGDPTNWYSFAGLDTDSYAATLGTDGAFTGAVTHLGYVLFWKENCIHKVYGSKPANFQISQTFCRGVQAGSEKSLCIVNETLYYKSAAGLCRYDGGLPEQISAALGDTPYTGAVGGAGGGCYYVSMADPGGGWHLFCYDPANGLWCREDSTRALAFAELSGKGYLLAEDGTLWQLEPEGEMPAGETDGPVPWCAETGMLQTAAHTAKYLARLWVRLWLPEGSAFKAELQYDDGPWEECAALAAAANQSLRLPLALRRCDHFRLRLSGVGPCKVYAVTRQFRAGREAKRHAGLG